jgi:hypothetical protein
MDTNYHINLVKKPTTGYNRTANDHVLAKQAEGLYPVVSQAMLNAVVNGDWAKYCQSIETYDQFVWEQSHKGNQTNIFANPKIKIGPSWAEQMWAPVFERVRLEIQKKWNVALELIQNKNVVETLGNKGPSSTKDVDNGIGIVMTIGTKEYIMPIVVGENKGGHYCKVQCNTVDGIIRRVLSMNKNVLAFSLTDNNVSVGKNVVVDHSFGSGGTLICQRGINGKKSKTYPALNVDKFELVERFCINYLSTKTPQDFLNISPSQTSGVLLRDHIDSKGHYVPPELTQYL